MFKAKKDKVKTLIQDNKTEKAIGILLISFKKQDDDLYNEVVLLNKRWDKWKTVDRSQGVKPDKHQQENRAIHFGLIELADELQESLLQRYLRPAMFAAIGLAIMVLLAMSLLSNIQYKGQVSDPEGNLISNAKVELVGTDKHTLSDQKGIFLIKARPTKEIRKIVISAEGYKTDEFRVQPWEEGATIPNFELKIKENE